VLTARFLDYDAASRTAHYRGDALLRAGRDEVRGEEIRLQERSEGAWRLEAEGGVRSLLHPGAGARPDAEAVQADARQMAYDESRSEIVYTGDARIRSGTMSTEAPRAVVSLGPDGQVATLTAGEPVKIVQGPRKADALRAVYRPAERRLELAGEPAHLTDPTQQVEGRVIVLSLGDDSVQVDGRDLGRTSTVIRRGP